MRLADDIRPTAALRFGAYLCLPLADPVRRALADLDLPALVSRLGLENEFEPGADHPPNAIAYLRRVSATPARAGIRDDALANAEAIIHVASDAPEPVETVRRELERRLEPHTLRVLSGVVRPPSYTGTAMHNYAYGRRVLQHSGLRMPNAFLLPLSKTPAWWQKSWMERHTFFLPRYDEAGAMQREGHALVAEPGIPCLMRRTYKQEREPAEAGAYDFINYFECADEDLPVFHQVCGALRDVRRNPEWRFVLEGPTWHGRRVASLEELYA